MARIAINGLGRIGRIVLKQALDNDDLEVVAVNDLTPLDNLVYLLRYDTVYGRNPSTVSASDDSLQIGDRRIPVFHCHDPAELPWERLQVDLVFECTGVFRQQQDLEKHLVAGAKHAILSAPPKGGDLTQVVYGTSDPEHPLAAAFSTASCTTNCVAPVMEILDRHLGVEKALFTTVHAYTGNQAMVDASASRWERGRAGAANLVPTSTGAATATAAVLPQLQGRLDGMAIRAPVPTGSISDITLVTARPTSADEINQLFRSEADSQRYRHVLAVSDDPLVSSDVIGDGHAATVDLGSTRVVGGDLVKVMAWYDNEWGYATQMLRQALHVLHKKI
ncbi:MAG: glyceraldehyde 3-phosphate dehydrogenase NAD-binding domain-containing protein [Alcanivorax sp.]|nr:glyceraldehyde 3-phosphate dehydrogenase NAD-binding domain-containing protein [Alcanivorax sp.]